MSVIRAVAGVSRPPTGVRERRVLRRGVRVGGVRDTGTSTCRWGGAGYLGVTVCGSQEKTPGVFGAAVTRSHWVAVEPYVSSRVRLGTPA